jgi:acyl carrier protein
MTIASRTPEGVPGHCPLCDAIICLEPSGPIGDAPCPYCGQLLWFVHVPPQICYFALDEVRAAKREKLAALLSRWVKKDAAGNWLALDLESLDATEFILEAEAALGMRLDEEKTRDLRNLGDLIDYLVSESPD